jgi:16S rRNA processing protein RimM
VTVYIERDGGLEPWTVESFRWDRNAPFLKLKGIDTLAAADALAGREVFVEPGAFRRLEADRFYDFELLGRRVVTPDGTEVGEVAGILEAGGPVLLVVKRGDREVYVPFAEGIVTRIDREADVVVIDPPDGLLDLNEI